MTVEYLAALLACLAGLVVWMSCANERLDAIIAAALDDIDERKKQSDPQDTP